MNPIKICRVCDVRYESFDEDDEDTCGDCWESIYEGNTDFFIERLLEDG